MTELSTLTLSLGSLKAPTSQNPFRGIFRKLKPNSCMSLAWNFWPTCTSICSMTRLLKQTLSISGRRALNQKDFSPGWNLARMPSRSSSSQRCRSVPRAARARNFRLVFIDQLVYNLPMEELREEDRNPLERLMEDTERLNFQERYIRWEAFLSERQEDPRLGQYLEKFIETFPFNASYWIRYAEEQLKKGKPDCLKVYQVALYKNPKCYSLWKAYLTWLNLQLTVSDPDFLKKELERGATIIGHNPNAGFILDLLKPFEKDLLGNWAIRTMFLKFPITLLSEILAETVEWVNSLQHEQLQMLSRHEKLIEVDDDKIKHLLVQAATKLKQASFKEYKARQEFESKIVQEEYTPYGVSTVDIWRRYLLYIKDSGHFEEIPTIYERALLSQCDNQGLWEEYFLYLEHDLGNSARVLDLLRSHSLFFSNLSIELQYYWIELEEREAPARARQLLIDLQRKKTLAETFLRHIQLQIRCKEFGNVKALYDTILTVFSSNTSIIAYIVLEYSEFVLKYFRDIEFPKKLLKNYFQAYGFNMYLFTGYMQFYIKHIQLKQSNRQLIDEFTNIVLTGLGKAKRALPHKQVANNIMRDYLNTIFSIKSTERKIKEQEIKIERGEDPDHKRPAEYQYESLSRKKKNLAASS